MTQLTLRRYSAVLLAAAFVGAVHLAGCDAAAPGTDDPVVNDWPASRPAIAGAVVPGRYVVVLEAAPSALTGGRLSRTAQSDLEALAATPGVERNFTYTAALVGFSAELTDAALAALRRDPRVRAVEPVVVATAADAVTQTGATWGIDRVDQRARPLSGTYTYDRTGAGVTVYVIDSGIRTSHAQFAGASGSRARLARHASGAPVDFTGGNGEDCNGHGTHVAASIGGHTAAAASYGIAKGVQLVSVRVLGCNNTGTTDGILAGINWVTANAAERPVVVNMSLRAGNLLSIETAVRNSVNAGLTYVVAASNDNSDACRATPARTPEAITVGATTSTDARASYSNFGSCLDLFAPGDQVLSASWENDAATRVRSGTSMATAHTSGAAALYLEANPAATPAQVSSALVAAATTGVVTDAKRGSPNRLLYTSPPATP